MVRNSPSKNGIALVLVLLLGHAFPVLAQRESLRYPEKTPLKPIQVSKSIRFWVPSYDLDPREIVVLKNLRDPQSIAVTDFYVETYQLDPSENVISVSLPVKNDLSLSDLGLIVKALSDLPKKIRAIVISWTKPYRVLRTSVTSALVFPEQVKTYSKGNNYSNWAFLEFEETAEAPSFLSRNDFFNALWGHESGETDSSLVRRPAMMLAGRNIDAVRDLITRGYRSRQLAIDPDREDAHFAITKNQARTLPRDSDFSAVRNSLVWRKSAISPQFFNFRNERSNEVTGKRVSFYFTGSSHLKELRTNHFEDGAIGDNLTSYGGRLFDHDHHQVTVLDWLEAGATGSYGTVVEPMGVQERFARASTLLEAYYSGATLVQAYWAAVKDPMMGLFVGDPLARPWGTRITFDEKRKTVSIKTTSLRPSLHYRVLEGMGPSGESVVESIPVRDRSVVTIEVPVEEGKTYSLVPRDQPYEYREVDR